MTVYGVMEYINLPYHEQESYLRNPLYKEKWRAKEEKRRLEELDYKYHEYDVVEYDIK